MLKLKSSSFYDGVFWAIRHTHLALNDTCQRSAPWITPLSPNGGGALSFSLYRGRIELPMNRGLNLSPVIPPVNIALYVQSILDKQNALYIALENIPEYILRRQVDQTACGDPLTMREVLLSAMASNPPKK